MVGTIRLAIPVTVLAVLLAITTNAAASEAAPPPTELPPWPEVLAA